MGIDNIGPVGGSSDPEPIKPPNKISKAERGSKYVPPQPIDEFIHSGESPISPSELGAKRVQLSPYYSQRLDLGAPPLDIPPDTNREDSLKHVDIKV